MVARSTPREHHERVLLSCSEGTWPGHVTPTWPERVLCERAAVHLPLLSRGQAGMVVAMPVQPSGYAAPATFFPFHHRDRLAWFFYRRTTGREKLDMLSLHRNWGIMITFAANKYVLSSCHIAMWGRSLCAKMWYAYKILIRQSLVKFPGHIKW